MHFKHYILFAVLGFTLLFILLPEKTDQVVDTTLSGGIVAHLPDPTSNNAAAGVMVEGEPYLFSFSGLGEGKERSDIHSRAYLININEQWARELPPLPGGKNRLASIAVAVAGTVYVIGGYTVAEDGHELSTPEVYAFDPARESYAELAPMPVPVDDTVAFVYQDRYIYLVSGWHDKGNVSEVQVYDTVEDIWFKATPYPGSPVFGHAGGIAGNRFVIADGVKMLEGVEGAGRFKASEEVYLGTIDADDPALISWRQLPPHPGNPLFRMAATGVADKNLVIFAGGSDNPYNFDGIGYDGAPSAPSASVFGFDIAAKEWRLYGEKPYPTMDHRGLVELDGRFYIIGGMTKGQEPSDAVSWFELPDRSKNDHGND
ncbi:MAG: galactose oxidase [Proteobacteria bacterium]|nr:galactose oxidase [Pseudomonadota bacterium]